MMNVSVNSLSHAYFLENTNDAINLYHGHLDASVTIKVKSLLNQLKSSNEKLGRNHHSMPGLLNSIRENLSDIGLSHVSILFFLEQLRIEKFYLGNHHLDLTHTLCRISEIYIESHQLSEAADYLSDAMRILNKGNKKGTTYAKTIFNIGLVKYHQSLHYDAFEMFNLAITEQRNALGDYHPDVSKMLVKIADLQLETGNLMNAMDNYKEALMIRRIIHGQVNSKIPEILIKIASIYKMKSEHEEALNNLHQALIATENLVDADKSMIHILSEMCLIYEINGDTKNSIKILQQIVEIIAEKLKGSHECVASALGLLRNMYVKVGMIESSAAIAENMRMIITASSNPIDYKRNNYFTTAALEILGYPIDSFALTAAAA